MLNISDNRVNEDIIKENFHSFDDILHPRLAYMASAWLWGIIVIALVILFLPWTQNTTTRGYVTTLYPDQRPQTIETTVAGRIEQWFVREGDTLQRGDTILYLSEIKDDYFDPELIPRMRAQINAKKSSIQAYRDKSQALSNQIVALRATQELKLDQGRNELEQAQFQMQADSIEVQASIIGDSVALVQMQRWQSLLDSGLESRTDFEKMQKTRQEAAAKLASARNKFAQSKVKIATARIKLANVRNEYAEKLAKAESDRQSALSSVFTTEGEVNKMENQQANYEQRQGFRYVLAPQTGLVNKILKQGLGETVKEGEPVIEMLPKTIQLAAEMYVRPMDMPLMKLGQQVRVEFDGWPTLIFGSGWPGSAFGTFGGEVAAIENNISPNGLYRVLVAEDPEDEPWPDGLRVGAGLNAFALFKDVPVWYEIWRQLNGFPPEYYESPIEITDPKKMKKNGKDSQPQN
ncbi:MAG: HlyD family efflux transporter periplasmic adaptor subunit, partial [Bacteroidota bacterium]